MLNAEDVKEIEVERLKNTIAELNEQVKSLKTTNKELKQEQSSLIRDYVRACQENLRLKKDIVSLKSFLTPKQQEKFETERLFNLAKNS